MNRSFLLDDTLQARLTEHASRKHQIEDQLLQEAVLDDLQREDGRAGFLADARRQALAVAASLEAELDKIFIDAASDWVDA